MIPSVNHSTRVRVREGMPVNSRILRRRPLLHFRFAAGDTEILLLCRHSNLLGRCEWLPETSRNNPRVRVSVLRRIASFFEPFVVVMWSPLFGLIPKCLGNNNGDFA